MNLFVLFLIRLFGASENETSRAFNFDVHLVLNLPVPNVHQNFGFTPLHVCATIMYHCGGPLSKDLRSERRGSPCIFQVVVFQSIRNFLIIATT